MYIMLLLIPQRLKLQKRKAVENHKHKSVTPVFIQHSDIFPGLW